MPQCHIGAPMFGSQHSSEHGLWCLPEEINAYKFGTTWEYVNDDNFHFWEEHPFKMHSIEMLVCTCVLSSVWDLYVFALHCFNGTCRTGPPCWRAVPHGGFGLGNKQWGGAPGLEEHNTEMLMPLDSFYYTAGESCCSGCLRSIGKDSSLHRNLLCTLLVHGSTSSSSPDENQYTETSDSSPDQSVSIRMCLLLISSCGYSWWDPPDGRWAAGLVSNEEFLCWIQSVL